MTIEVVAKTRDDVIDLVAPKPGLFRCGVAVGDVIRPGGTLGLLEVLGTHTKLVAPDVSGRVVALHDATSARPAIDFGSTLVTIDPRAVAGAERSNATTSAAVTGNVFRAPTSGRFYGRPSPDKPPFVEAGTQLVRGATICLLEVMKTFHRVTYQGEPATVERVLVAEGADVNAGDPLVALA